MTDKPKTKSKAKKTGGLSPKARARAAKSAVGIRMGKQPDHVTKHKIRCRTQTGWKLYLPAIEFWAPGEDTEIEVTAAQLEHLKLDGRIMIDDQIDAFELELEGIKDRKPHGTRVPAPKRTHVPEGLAVNRPGGPLLPNVKQPDDARSYEDMASDERKFLEKSAGKKPKRGRRAI